MESRNQERRCFCHSEVAEASSQSVLLSPVSPQQLRAGLSSCQADKLVVGAALSVFHDLHPGSPGKEAARLPIALWKECNLLRSSNGKQMSYITQQAIYASFLQMQAGTYGCIYVLGVQKGKKKPKTQTPVLYHLIGLDTQSINITPWRQEGKIS